MNRTLVALELGDGGYREVANLQPEDEHDFERPFQIRISMPELCRELDRR